MARFGIKPIHYKLIINFVVFEKTMLIEKHLPQFDKEKALLVVAGKKEAKLFVAKKGVLEELDLFILPKPKYTDREGFYKSDAEKGMSGSGSVYEPKKNYEIKVFLHRLRDEMKFARNEWKFTSIYLFSPGYLAKEIFAVLPSEFCDMVKFKLTGNFVKSHPFELLQKIKKEYEKILGAPVIKSEARKLMKKKEITDEGV